ncbi:RidA family protein [Propionivibrio limicola]|uniref:RidA family protein n=1 Tax=Propionivibrio limicola TaxID=167645 RepID=UPI0012910712|nr:RidA family protein [Propionivibrio limicola]
MEHTIIHTTQAPQAVGTYSQAVQAGSLVFLSGQLGIDPTSGNLVEGFDAQAHQAFRNLRAVCQAAGADLKNIVRVGVFLTDMANFARFNQIMGEYFDEPYPARAAVQVAGLPKGGVVEAEAILVK